MVYLGSILFALWLILITPIFSLIALIVTPLPPLLRYKIIVNWARLVILGALIFCRIKYRVIGKENIPKTPVIFLSRHESAWETIAYLFIFSPTTFVLKKSLLHIPFFGWGLRRMSPIAIDRGSPQQALRQICHEGKKCVMTGFNVVIFPEGSRLNPGEERDYFLGGAFLAKKSSTDVVPVAINSGQCWGKNSFFKRAGCITVHIGEVIKTEDKTYTQINEHAKMWISSTCQQLETDSSSS